MVQHQRDRDINHDGEPSQLAESTDDGSSQASDLLADTHASGSACKWSPKRISHFSLEPLLRLSVIYIYIVAWLATVSNGAADNMAAETAVNRDAPLARPRAEYPMALIGAATSGRVWPRAQLNGLRAAPNSGLSIWFGSSPAELTADANKRRLRPNRDRSPAETHLAGRTSSGADNEH